MPLGIDAQRMTKLQCALDIRLKYETCIFKEFPVKSFLSDADFLPSPRLVSEVLPACRQHNDTPKTVKQFNQVFKTCMFCVSPSFAILINKPYEMGMGWGKKRLGD